MAMSHLAMLYKYGKHAPDWLSILFFSLVFFILGAFLIKQFFNS